MCHQCKRWLKAIRTVRHPSVAGNLAFLRKYLAFLRRHKELSVRKPERISRTRLLVRELYLREWLATLRPNVVNQQVTNLIDFARRS